MTKFEDSCILDTSGFEYDNVVDEKVIEKWKNDITAIEESKGGYRFHVYHLFIISFVRLGTY